MKFTVYHVSTGEIAYTGECPEEDFDLQARPGMGLIQGQFSERTHYWDADGLQMVEKAARPSPDHRWDVASRTWLLDVDRVAAKARARRTQLLRASDWTQLGDIDPSTTQAWRSYRQALRNVPQQPGFPLSIQWPEAPTS